MDKEFYQLINSLREAKRNKNNDIIKRAHSYFKSVGELLEVPSIKQSLITYAKDLTRPDFFNYYVNVTNKGNVEILYESYITHNHEYFSIFDISLVHISAKHIYEQYKLKHTNFSAEVGSGLSLFFLSTYLEAVFKRDKLTEILDMYEQNNFSLTFLKSNTFKFKVTIHGVG